MQTLTKDELNVKSRPEAPTKATEEERMEFSELFHLDSDDEEGQKKKKYIFYFVKHIKKVIIDECFNFIY